MQGDGSVVLPALCPLPYQLPRCLSVWAQCSVSGTQRYRTWTVPPEPSDMHLRQRDNLRVKRVLTGYSVSRTGHTVSLLPGYCTPASTAPSAKTQVVQDTVFPGNGTYRATIEYCIEGEEVKLIALLEPETVSSLALCMRLLNYAN